MASRQLKWIFGISIPIFMAHGLEEWATCFYGVDSHYKWLFSPFDGMPANKATFLLFNLMAWLWLWTGLLLSLSPKWQLPLAILPGILYLFELHHFLDLYQHRRYTPGLVTSAAFPFLAFLFWRQWMRDVAAAVRDTRSSAA
jgi:hypothetical protein